MPIIHECSECRVCFNCGLPNCTNYLPPNKMKETLEDGWHVKRCYNCNDVIEKFKSLQLLEEECVSSSDVYKNLIK